MTCGWRVQAEVPNEVVRICKMENRVFSGVLVGTLYF
jgi:hypothetical protein